MAEKTINTRIINKHGALSTWLSSSLVLKEGEIALAYITTTKPDGQGGTYEVPTYLMKVGDGKSTFSSLEWVAAPASDVYSWAKKANLDINDIPMTDVANNLQDTFYTESEIDSKIATIDLAIGGKADSGHSHTITAAAEDDDVVVLSGTAGTNGVSYTATHANSGVTAGTYKSVTVDAKGHVTAGTNPTTLAGYGINNAYTKTEVDAELAKKSDTGHTHAYLPDTTTYAGSSTQGGAANSVKSNLTVKLNSGTTEGTNLFTFNGSAAKTINITPSSIGAAATSHSHDDKYYTETEIDSKIATINTAIDGKSSSSHTHGNISNTGTLDTASRVVITDSDKKVAVSTITTTKLGYLSDVTSNIQTQLDGKAATSTTLAGYGITNAYTKAEVDAELAKKSESGHNHDNVYIKPADVDTKIATALSSALKYKGTKAKTSELPTSGNATGDVWNISSACAASGTLPKVNAGDNVAWNGSAWDVLAGTVDLSSYYNKSQVDAELAKKSDTGHTHNYAGSSSAGGPANSVAQSITFNNGGSGAASGTTFNGSTARTISYNTIGAAPASHTHTKDQITDFAHNHDDRYYTESEIDSKIATINDTIDNIFDNIVFDCGGPTE